MARLISMWAPVRSGRLCSHGGSAQLLRHRVPERDSGQRGWNPGAERGRVWAGSRGHNRFAGGDLKTGKMKNSRRPMRLRVPHKHFQHQRARPLRHLASHVCFAARRVNRKTGLWRLADGETGLPGPVAEATSLAEESSDAVRQIRASKAMLITPGDEDSRSAGSFFKNPVLSSEAPFAKLKQRAGALHKLEIPSYPALESKKKSSSGMAGGELGISQRVWEWPGGGFPVNMPSRS